MNWIKAFVLDQKWSFMEKATPTFPLFANPTFYQYVYLFEYIFHCQTPQKLMSESSLNSMPSLMQSSYVMPLRIPM